MWRTSCPDAPAGAQARRAAAWSLVHGLASLLVNGNLRHLDDDELADPAELARRVLALLRPGDLGRHT